MLSITKIVNEFGAEAISILKEEDNLSNDNNIIDLLNNQQELIQNPKEASDVIRKWLNRYNAFQRLSNNIRVDVSNAVIRFAETPLKRGTILNQADIIEQFNTLYAMCSNHMPRRKNGHPRDCTSITSKALWCCYPDSIPLYDSYAKRALTVMGKLDRGAQNLSLSKGSDNEYANFVAVWHYFYEQAQSSLDQLSTDYSYKVRVFDKILWLIGKDDYQR